MTFYHLNFQRFKGCTINTKSKLQPVQAADHRRDRISADHKRRVETVLSADRQTIRTEKHDTDNQYRLRRMGRDISGPRYGQRDPGQDPASCACRVHYRKVLSDERPYQEEAAHKTGIKQLVKIERRIEKILQYLSNKIEHFYLIEFVHF